VKISDIRTMGRATQGVRLINLEKRNDEIASVCKVNSEEEMDGDVEIVLPEDVDGEENLTVENNE